MNIHAICYYYPPLNSSEGFSAFKLFSASKHKINVWSQKSLSSWTYSYDEMVISNVNYIPIVGSYKGWWKALEVKDWSSVNILITRSMPNFSHTIGYKIKKRNQEMKWIAFFSDPFNSSPINLKDRILLINDLINHKKYFKVLFIKIKNILIDIITLNEAKKIYRNADYLIFNNAYQLDFMLKKFPKYRTKSLVIPHTYADNNIVVQNCKCNCIVFSFIGNLSKVRNLNNFLLAVHEIKNDLQYKNKAVFRFVGCDKKLLSDNIDLDLVDFVDNVSYENSLKLMMESDWLINSDASIDDTITDYVYLPCKLVDYLSCTSNVLNISNFLNSPTVEMVNSNGGVNIKDDKNEILIFLKNVINDNKKRTSPSDNIKQYNNKMVVNKLDKILDEISMQIKMENK